MPPQHRNVAAGKNSMVSIPPLTMMDSSSALRFEKEDAVALRNQLQLLNCLAQPIWVFDFTEERNRWINNAGLDLWDAPDVEEFCSRDRKNAGFSAATIKKLEQIQNEIEQGRSVTVQWTLYPKGVAVTVDITATAIRLDCDEDGHHCMLMQAVAVDKERLEAHSLRGMEMLRHLPMAVCQFDMSGNIMYQNQWAEMAGEPPSSPKATFAIDPSSASTFECLTTSNNECSIKSFPVSPAGTSATPQYQQTSSSPSPPPMHDFMRRFMDPSVARETFQAIQTTTDEVLKVQAELRSTTNAEAGVWSEVSMRKTTDPVTGKTVILYSAEDKSDAQTAEKVRTASMHKSECLAMMAHEIRTPLHQVIGCIDLLDQTKPLTREQKEYVKLLQSSSEGLMTIINDVLDFSKLEAGQMKIETIPYDALSVVRGSIAAVRASCDEKNLSLTLDWMKEVPFRLMGDPNRFRQVLLNLLSNAIKFTKSGGIRVQGSLLNHQDVQEQNITTTLSAERWIKITVSDTGVGICEQNQALIFQKYQQENVSIARNHGGTGLGLSICQLLVHSMGGAIGVKSQPGLGSDFWFVLPVMLPQQQAKDSIIAVAKCDLELKPCDSRKVLVAEDDIVNQKLIVSMLKRLGHQPTIAENGQIAIDMLEDKNNSFDLVLMDLQMPVMDGLEATRRLRTMGYNKLPILALTASARNHDCKEFDDWLSKPLKLKQLRDKVLGVKRWEPPMISSKP